MANLLNVQETENKLFKNKGGDSFHKKVYHINRKDDKTINSVLFRDIYDNFANKYGSKNVMVRALNNTQYMTFKGFGDTILNFENFNEYYENRVKDASKFEYFYSIEISVID
jgi:hypothetical protein